MTIYSPAPAVKRIAADLIRDCHRHLDGVHVEYVFRDEAAKSKGKPVMGAARLISGLNAYLALNTDQRLIASAIPDSADRFFCIEIAEDIWQRLPEPARVALVDHELCVPAGTMVTGPQVEASVMRWYSGQMVEIRTAAGHFLAGTPNHPILTDCGWSRLDALQEGNYVVSSRFPEWVSSAMDPNEYQVPALIEQIARPVSVLFGLMPESAEDLDPDVVDGQVQVVSANRRLLLGAIPTGEQHRSHVIFSGRNGVQVQMPRHGELSHRFVSMVASTPSSVRLVERNSSCCALLGVGESIHLSGTAITNRHAGLGQQPVNHAAADSEFFLQRILGSPGGVTLDKVLDVHVRPFSGHVYNLQTSQGWYSANNIITHNCHCVVDGEGVLGLVTHDVEEFQSVIERHGAWTGEVRQFVKTGAEQLGLFDKVAAR